MDDIFTAEQKVVILRKLRGKTGKKKNKKMFGVGKAKFYSKHKQE